MTREADVVVQRSAALEKRETSTRFKFCPSVFVWGNEHAAENRGNLSEFAFTWENT